LNIGLGRADSVGLPEHVREFCDFLEREDRVAQIPDDFVGHAYQLYEKTRPRLSDTGVVLVGDAAGLAYPMSGEGIRPAVESGLIAAEVIIQAAHRTTVDLGEYDRRILAHFGKPRRSGLSRWLPMAWLQGVGSRLMATEWFARHVVMNRWFLHASETTCPEFSAFVSTHR
jgi:flavin-dependent dehydrogenase